MHRTGAIVLRGLGTGSLDLHGALHDLVDLAPVLVGEADVGGPSALGDVVGTAGADDGHVDGGMEQGPGDGQLTNGPVAVGGKRWSSATSSRLVRNSSPSNMGLALRQSSSPKLVSLLMAPVSSPWASGP